MKKHINRIISLIIVLNIQSVSAQELKLSSFITDSLDHYMNRSLTDWEVPGAAVAIIKDGKIAYMKGFGVLEMDGNEKVDENTLFMIGSNTKAFTATAIAMLEHEGKCSLEDKVQRWLPGFTMKDQWVAKELNLTDILSHRIGMETFQGDFMYWTSNLTWDEVIEKFGKLTPMYGFRSKWGYTNAGFAIAGKCIGKISSMPWENFIDSYIIKPLEMDRTVTLSTLIPSSKNAARPHTLVNGKLERIPYPIIDNLASAGSISSSVSDMSHWVICLLDSGRYKGKQVIPWQAIMRTREPESIIGRTHSANGKSHYQLYGLGWELQDYAGREIVSHTGGVNGFLTSVTLVPEEKTGIIVFTNTDMNSLYYSTRQDILDVMLGLPYRNNNVRMLSEFRKGMKRDIEMIQSKQDSVKMNLKSTFTADKYIGKYTNEVYGNSWIKVDGNSLILTFEHHPKLIGKMESLGSDRFVLFVSGPADLASPVREGFWRNMGHSGRMPSRSWRVVYTLLNPSVPFTTSRYSPGDGSIEMFNFMLTTTGVVFVDSGGKREVNVPLRS